jgi:hypothetical protein
VSTFNQKPGIGERNCKISFNAHRIRLRDVLKMQHRADQQFLTTLQDASCRAYASPVLVEALRGRVAVMPGPERAPPSTALPRSLLSLTHAILRRSHTVSGRNHTTKYRIRRNCTPPPADHLY